MKPLAASYESSNALTDVNIEADALITNQSYKKWLDAGYQQFASEGLDGIQVERLARNLRLNKSGFYYYFGDREFYLGQLLKFHLTLCNKLAQEMQTMTQFDPDFFNILINNKQTVMVQMQLLRYRHHDLCNACYIHANKVVDIEIIPQWSTFIGIPGDPILALQFFRITRDLIYSRITSENMSHQFLRNLILEVKEVAQNLLEKDSKAASH